MDHCSIWRKVWEKSAAVERGEKECSWCQTQLNSFLVLLYIYGTDTTFEYCCAATSYKASEDLLVLAYSGEIDSYYDCKLITS